MFSPERLFFLPIIHCLGNWESFTLKLMVGLLARVATSEQLLNNFQWTHTSSRTLLFRVCASLVCKILTKLKAFVL